MTKTATERVYNFSPGPAALPVAVIEKIQEELLSFRGCGISMLELTHRSKEFGEVIDSAKSRIRQLLQVGDDYDILFLQGGARHQFGMIPMNLYLEGKPVDVIHTGTWTKQAISDLKRIASYNLAASTEDRNFLELPSDQEIKLNKDASYVHLCSNNTIYGTQWKEYPKTGEVPLVADMTSDIMSRPFDIKKFGVVMASAQKNLGISGVTLVIIRKDLLKRSESRNDIPVLMSYAEHSKADSLLNTAPTFAIYVMELILEWIQGCGGLEKMAEINHAKAAQLYDVVDASSLYNCPVKKEDRSDMNVVFRLTSGGEELEKKFLAEAKKEKLTNLKGHRSVGGFRASIYNAQTPEAVSALAEFMKKFEAES